MQRIGDEYPAIDPSGRAVPSATVLIYASGDAAHTPVTVYSATGIATPIVPGSNPLTTDSYGRWSVALPDGRYDIQISGTGFASYTIPNICVFDNTVTYPSPMLGTVTSVQLAMPAEFAVVGGPVTGVGTLTVSYGNWAASKLLIAPLAGGTPTLRNLALGDLPNFGGAAAAYGSGTLVPVITVNAQGIPTGFATAAVTPGWASITGKPSTVAGYGVVDSVRVLFVATASVLCNTTTAETSMIGTGVGSTTIAANSLRVGSVIRFRGWGLSNYVTAVDTLRLKLKFGGVIVVDTTAQIPYPTIAVNNNDTVEFEGELVVLTLGAVGTMVGSIKYVLHQRNVGNMYAVAGGGTHVTSNVDTTVNAALDMTMQWGGIHTSVTISQMIIKQEA